ncbi:hypothetical protein GCM10010191_12430 [Actinomadura vinacea]|uniref:MarR family transcriptional regulator n=1 Tax=Actinomadura vinacea TaxID=115336 RepID=A0ABN3IK50_9ACTN
MATNTITATGIATVAGAAEMAGDATGNDAAGFHPTGAAQAVWNVLVKASNGATVTAIAEASGVSRSAVTKALSAFAEDGHAVRSPGAGSGRGRTPDVWAPVTADTATDTGADSAPPIVGVTAGTGADVDTVGQGDNTGGTDNGPDNGDATGARSGGDDGGDPAPEGMPLDESLRAAMRILSEEAARRAEAEEALRRAHQEEAERRAHVDAELAKAHMREATRTVLADLLGAVTATLAAVTDDDHDRMVAGLEQVDNYARALRGAARQGATGRAAGRGARPGAAGPRSAPRPLRPAVVEHLRAHPGKEFTPGEIARVLDRSPGAVANALDTLVAQDVAELTCERPRRFRLADGTGAAATIGGDVPQHSDADGIGAGQAEDA